MKRDIWGYRLNQIGNELIIFDAANEYMGACYIILFQEDGGETVRSRNLNHAL